MSALAHQVEMRRLNPNVNREPIRDDQESDDALRVIRFRKVCVVFFADWYWARVYRRTNTVASEDVSTQESSATQREMGQEKKEEARSYRN